jgi:hypothetical protein
MLHYGQTVDIFYGPVIWLVLMLRSLLFFALTGSMLCLTVVGQAADGIPVVPREQQICFALYTVQDHTLKMTAQFYPLATEDSRVATLHIKQQQHWQPVANVEITEDEYGNESSDKTWTAHFRVDDWDPTRDWDYRITALDGVANYEGIIRRDPVDKSTIVVAAFTGNSINQQHGGDIPRSDIVANIKRIDPDLLFFSGDQVYDHTHHLRSWLRFGSDFGDITRDRPTVTIPDDHDVGQANLWGEAGGIASTPAGPDGGYYMPASYVKAVERAQTWHLPDAVDPRPVGQGIGVYFTSLNLGPVDFAIIEDRKFKTGPEGVIPRQGPRPDHITDPNYDPRTVDVPGADLLGERQLDFLRSWGQDWTGAKMKAVLSQTIFCGGAHVHGKLGGRLHADLDSNGWPQTGRNKALAEMRRCQAVHIAGDQHLGSIFHHGIDDWEDATVSFCVPSIANLYLRWWDPLEPGGNRTAGSPAYTGRHLDGFGNRVTCYAAANPTSEPADGSKLTTRAAGFGVIRFDTVTRQITFECWPRNVNVDDPTTQQYTGWPRTIHQSDNDGRRPAAYLPKLEITGQTDAVVQVIDETNNEVIYTIRIAGDQFTPAVFKAGRYTVKVGEGEQTKEFPGIASSSQPGQEMQVEFDKVAD